MLTCSIMIIKSDHVKKPLYHFLCVTESSDIFYSYILVKNMVTCEYRQDSLTMDDVHHINPHGPTQTTHLVTMPICILAGPSIMTNPNYPVCYIPLMTYLKIIHRKKHCLR